MQLPPQRAVNRQSHLDQRQSRGRARRVRQPRRWYVRSAPSARLGELDAQFGRIRASVRGRPPYPGFRPDRARLPPHAMTLRSKYELDCFQVERGAFQARVVGRRFGARVLAPYRALLLAPYRWSWRRRRGRSLDRLRRRLGGLLLTTRREERRGNHDGNHCRFTEQPMAGRCFGKGRTSVAPWLKGSYTG